MTLQELFTKCDLTIATEQQMLLCESFSCGTSEDERDLNDFFANDSMSYQKRLLGKTYIFTRKQSATEIENNTL